MGAVMQGLILGPEQGELGRCETLFVGNLGNFLCNVKRTPSKLVKAIFQCQNVERSGVLRGLSAFSILRTGFTKFQPMRMVFAN